jgi:ABC-type glycerol-3-phosphate transport system substrate-binding protein
MLKRTLFLLAVFVFVCGTLVYAAGKQGGTSAQSGGVTNLRWLMQVGSEIEGQQWRELAADVNKKFSDITVELATTDWNGYWTKLPTEIAGGNPPDILYMQVMRAKSFFANGFEPIDSYVAQDPTVNLADFYKGVLDGLSDEGKLYCLPYDFGPYVMFYNMDLFDRRGVPYPDDKFDILTYLDICAKLSGNGTYGAAIAANIDRSNPFIWGEGVNYFDSRGRFVINQPKVAEVLEKQAELIRSGLAPRQTDTGNYQWDREQFYSGTVGMMPDGPWNLTNIKKSGNFRVGAALVPAGTVRRASPVAGSGFGIAKGSKNKDKAYKAITSLTSPESLTKLAQWGRALPSRASVRNVYYEMHTDVRGLREAVERSCEPDIGLPYLTTKNWQEVYNAINQNIEPVFLGSMDVKTALNNAQKIIDGVLGQ